MYNKIIKTLLDTISDASLVALLHHHNKPVLLYNRFVYPWNGIHS